MNELRATLTVINKLGLHARAAGLLVKLAQEYKQTQLWLSKGGTNEINGKSIMGVLTLAAAKGEQVRVRVWGEGAPELLDRLKTLFLNKFGEAE